MTARQRRAWSFAAATVPAVMVCAANAWQWVLFGCAAAALLHLYMYLARRRHGLCLTESYAAAFGAPLGRALLGLTALWTPEPQAARPPHFRTVRRGGLPRLRCCFWRGLRAGTARASRHAARLWRRRCWRVCI